MSNRIEGLSPGSLKGGGELFLCLEGDGPLVIMRVPAPQAEVSE